MVDDARVSTNFIRTLSERDSDIKASMHIRKGWTKSARPSMVRCCKCGIEGEPKDMGYIGNNVYKCVYCLLGTKEGK